MNEHPACVTRGGDDTADDGGTDSFWRDFVIYARVVHEGKARGRTREGSETTRGERRGEKSRARERIMNRLFISFSSVKLLRMAHP